VAGRRGAVVEDDFYNKLERLNVQAGKKGKILVVLCEARDTVMRSYYQQLHFILPHVKDILKTRVVWG